MPTDPDDGVRIASLLPDPVGVDAGHERITIANGTGAGLTLSGWTLRDRGQNVFSLSGSIPAGSSITVTLAPNSMPLNNSGDEVFLIDESATIRHKVTYEAGQVHAGVVIVIP